MTIDVTMVPKQLYYHEVAHVRYLERMRERMLKIKAKYESQIRLAEHFEWPQFADAESITYFRDFTRELDEALKEDK